MDITELQNQAIEIRDAENEGENTALRVGTMLLAIIDAFANIVDLDTLQQILEQYAGTTGSGQIYWRHARCVFLASMGADFDAVNGDGWEYTNHNGDIVFNPTSKNLRVVGETGTYFVAANVLYVHAHTCHTYKWDAAEQKMVEIADTNLPTVITYKNTPAFSQVAIGESYVFQSQSSGPKIAIKISSSETYSFLPDPKKIYAFRDIRQAMLWKPSNQTWVSLTPRVINDLTTGGEGDALSAEMGKKIRQNITILLNRLGEYAFPNGKPTLDWSGGGGGGGDDPVVPTYEVQKTIGTGLSASGGDDDVSEGDSLEVTISVTNNLYIIDEDNVEVTMDGSPVDGAFDAATGKITIAEVYGDVVINVPSMTYALPSNLSFHLDCKNRGGQAGHWIDRIGGVDFKLTNVTEADSGMVFNGSSSKGVVMDDNDPTQPAALGSKYVDVAFDAGTIEVIAEADSGSLPTANNRTTCPVFINPKDGGLIAAFRMGGASTSYASCLLFMYTCKSSGVLDDNLAFLYNGSTTIQGVTYTANGGNNIAVSAHTNLTVDGIVRIDGITQQNAKWFDTWIGGPSQTRFAVGYYYRNNNGTITETFFKGKIKAIRVYNTKLTEQQMIQNYKVDKKRFNLQ